MKTLALILSLAFAGCATTQPCPVDVTKPCPKPAPTCATACAQGAKLKCLWATPTPMGASCLDDCNNAAQTVPWDVAALSTTSTCNP